MNDYPLKSVLSNTKLKAYICAIMEAPSSLMLYDLDTGEWRINNFLNTELTSWNVLDSEFITQLDQQLVPDLMNGTDVNHKVFSIQFNTIKLPNSITFSIRYKQSELCKTLLVFHVSYRKPYTERNNVEMYEILSVGRNVEELVDLSRKNRENSTLLLDILTKVSHDIRPPICNLIALSDHCNEMLEDKNLSKEWIQSFTTLVYELDHLSIELSNVIDNKIDHTYEL